MDSFISLQPPFEHEPSKSPDQPSPPNADPFSSYPSPEQHNTLGLLDFGLRPPHRAPHPSESSLLGSRNGPGADAFEPAAHAHAHELYRRESINSVASSAEGSLSMTVSTSTSGSSLSGFDAGIDDAAPEPTHRGLPGSMHSLSAPPISTPLQSKGPRRSLTSPSIDVALANSSYDPVTPGIHDKNRPGPIFSSPLGGPLFSGSASMPCTPVSGPDTLHHSLMAMTGHQHQQADGAVSLLPSGLPAHAPPLPYNTHCSPIGPMAPQLSYSQSLPSGLCGGVTSTPLSQRAAFANGSPFAYPSFSSPGSGCSPLASPTNIAVSPTSLAGRPLPSPGLPYPPPHSASPTRISFFHSPADSVSSLPDTPRSRLRQPGPPPLIVSSADKLHVCHCGKRFKRLEHLKRHNRTHTQERPFRCPQPGCGKYFSRTDNLAQHVKTHFRAAMLAESPKKDLSGPWAAMTARRRSSVGQANTASHTALGLNGVSRPPTSSHGASTSPNGSKPTPLMRDPSNTMPMGSEAMMAPPQPVMLASAVSWS